MQLFDNIHIHEIKHMTYLNNIHNILDNITCLYFFSIRVFFQKHSRFTRQQGKRGAYIFKSSLPLPPASQTLRHQPGNYCGELTSAHSQQPDSNRELLVFESKSLTTKLRAQHIELTVRQSIFNDVNLEEFIINQGGGGSDPGLSGEG